MHSNQIKTGNWIHSWYVDTIFFNIIPIIIPVLFVFKLFPFNGLSAAHFNLILIWVFAIDWGHLFAQWLRIHSNPLETKPSRFKLTSLYLVLVLFFMFLIEANQDYGSIFTFVTYFVIYHSIRQHFGFIRIYSKTDGLKTKIDSFFEKSFIYLSMITPVVYWHISFTDPKGIWHKDFIKHDGWKYAFVTCAFFYGISFISYCLSEYKRTKINKNFNIAKNLAVVSTVFGWGIISFLPQNPLIITLTVQLTHNISYVVLIWIIGRRDTKIMNGVVPLISWFSKPGLFFYALAILVVSQTVMVVYKEMSFDFNHNYFIVGTALNWIPKGTGVWEHLGRGIFFATQIHHFIIDAYIWKKEKDLPYMIKTGQFSLKSRAIST